MKRWNVFTAAILACACVTTIEGPPLDETAGTGAAAGNSTATGAVGGAAPQGGAVSGGSSGSFAGTTTIGGTGSGGTSVGGLGVGGLGGTTGTGVGGTGGNNAAGSGGAGTGGAGVSGSGALAGAGSGGMDTGTTGATFAQVRDLIVEVCAAATCHGGREMPNLSAANLYMTLTNTAVRECGNDRLVTARDTANSAVLEMLNGQCGDLLMPESCMAAPCLGSAEQAIISSWISAGAPP